MSLKKAGIIIFLILLIDQISKIYIKTHFALGEEIEVFDWFSILFVENEGMAWGTKIPGEYGKLALTLFRLAAIVGIGYWLWDAVRKNGSRVLIVSIALIFAGAFGNIIDSVFYGKVVDMLYFPLWKGYLPGWVPFWGGEYFTFFEPVFNIADSAISVGVALLLIFNKKAFPKEEE